MNIADLLLESHSDGWNTILSNIKWTQTSFYNHRMNFKNVHLLMIELEHLNFGFERTDIEHRTSNLKAPQ